MLQLKNYFLLIALALSLSSCALLERREPDVRYVEIPTPAPCVTWQPEKPVLTFSALPADAPLHEQVRALLIDLSMQIDYSDALVMSQENCIMAPRLD